VTGFVADDADDLAGLAARVDELEPTACRRAAEERFDAKRLVAAYDARWAHWIAWELIAAARAGHWSREASRTRKTRSTASGMIILDALHLFQLPTERRTRPRRTPV
jgi:hypothetical protein